MGYTTAVPEGTTYGNFHVPCWLLSFPRELGLMAVKVAQVVLDFTIPDMTISFHFPQQVFTYMWAHYPLPSPSLSMCVEPSVSPPQSGDTAPDALKTLELGESWSPHVYCPSSLAHQVRVWPLPPFLNEPVLCGKEGQKIMFIRCSNIICTKCISLLIPCILLKNWRQSQKWGFVPSWWTHVLFASHIWFFSICKIKLYLFSHYIVYCFFTIYKQDFHWWYSRAGKQKYGDKKNICEETEFHFSPALFELQYLYLQILNKCLTFSLFLHLLFSQFRFPLSVLLHVLR